MASEHAGILGLDAEILRTRQRLIATVDELSDRLWLGESPWTISEELGRLREELVAEALSRCLQRAGLRPADAERGLAVVAYAGFARGDLAPYSDTDLLFLVTRRERDRLRGAISELAKQLVDCGLEIGHYTLRPIEVWQLASRDPVVFTSFCESRLLWGSKRLYRQFWLGLRLIGYLIRPLLYNKIIQARAEERERFGETVYLNEPHVKRSQGALRDVHMIRWLGFMQGCLPPARSFAGCRILNQDDLASLQEAWTFLLRVRQAMHFDAQRASDMLTRWQQLRLSERFGYKGGGGLLPAEEFMREYFRHTYAVSRCLRLLAEELRPFVHTQRLARRLFGQRIGQDWIVTRESVVPTRTGWLKLTTRLEAVLELASLSIRANKPIEAYVWERIRDAHGRCSSPPSPQARALFWRLLENSTRLGEILTNLHEAGMLEQFVPGLSRAKGLLQFNQYHKYTVDRHCLRALEWATELARADGLLGQVYRQIPRKAVLHFALLMHDLGKGFEEDHCQVAKRLAEEAANQFSLSPADAEDFVFLVSQHLLMNHLAFRRDINDEHLVVRFAVEVGSAERLAMLFVLTAADLAAVGPGGWNSWKADVLSELYQRAHRYLTGDMLAAQPEIFLHQQREAVARWLGPLAEKEFFARQLSQLPSTYLSSTPPWRIAEDLRLLARLRPQDVHVEVVWNTQRETLTLLLATNEAVGTGIFHKLVGAISSEGWEILAADIHTLADGWVIDRVEARDPDFVGQPPDERLQAVANKVRHSVRTPGVAEFRFRQSWFTRATAQATVARARTRVQISNHISPQFTVIDVFAVDRPGLLFTIAKKLFELGLSVARARIGTYLDQVVDVFYVTDQAGKPIVDETRVDTIRREILTAVESLQQD